jgi:hypothetical protein
LVGQELGHGVLHLKKKMISFILATTKNIVAS